ncbi:MAG TPA: gas vesicle protein GvpD P-loop domain-containing protein [Thermoplasmata archaeon]|nr:gas vesicle protein GvpD P-loop domain-containing protein [Thermoplasmata archaeon]
MAKEAGIPEELLQFFRASGGHSLIVKGPAGTGKTTFALQLAEELGEGARSYYMSIRVSDQSLFRQFPWLKEKREVAQHFQRVMQADSAAREDEKPGPGKVDRTELQKLEGRVELGQEGDEVYQKVGEGEVTNDSLIFDLGSDLPEIDLAYDEVERNLPQSTLVLVDSIDGLSERYGIVASKLVNTLQKDLVEKGNANVVYVLESTGDTKLDYLGDGVILFQSLEHMGRRLRVMTIEKLRGTEIHQHKYIYTLKDGRIRAFGSGPPGVAAKAGLWEPVEDLSKDVVSWGHSALDQLIGGLRLGSIVALEVDPDVPSTYVNGLRLGLLCNFASLGRGVAYVPAQRGTAETVQDWVSPHLKAGAFDQHVRVFESSPLGSMEGSKNALHMEGANVDTDLKWSNVEYRLPGSKHPFLAFFAFDTLESVYGESVLEQMTGQVSSIRRNRDILIGKTGPLTRSTPKLANLAHMHLKVQNMNGSILLFGQKPYTELFNLSFTHERGFPRAVLTPIV